MSRVTVLLGLVLSAVCLGAFVWNADWDAIGDAFAAVDPLWVVAGALGMWISLVGRAWRWRVLLGPAHPTTFRHRLTTTAIGFMGNTIFPGRIGEPLRAFMLARLEPHVSFTTAIATLVIERLFDLLATLVALVIFLAFEVPPAGRGDVLGQIRVVGWTFALGLLVAVVALLGVSALPAARVGAVLGRILPARVASAIEHVVTSFRAGLDGLRSPLAVVQALGFTAVVWLAILSTSWCMLRAFHFDDLGILEALGLMVVLCFAVALPQAPGYLGVFQVASEATLVGLYGVPAARAKAFAIALWAAQQLPMVAAGALSLWVEGVSLRDVKRDVEAQSPAH
jgi:uncharacterized protein (TIRG00374 family)